jgi:hypothetical protein
MATELEVTNDRWTALRREIIQLVLGNTPEHKRDRLDVVNALQAEFPECGWLEIATWMDGTNQPTDSQQLAFSNWVKSQNQITSSAIGLTGQL